MSESADSNPSEVKRGLGCAVKLALLILVLFFAFMLMAARVGRVLGALAFGWLNFLKRTVPEISWNWDLVGMAALCVALIVLMGHHFASWISSSIASRRGADWKWPWKWTYCGLFAVGLAFLVGMSVGGAVHQIGWLSSQGESWYERKGEDVLDMRQLDAGLQQALIDVGYDPAKLRQELRNPDSYLHHRSGEVPIIEKFHVLLILEGTNEVAGAIIFPRDPSKRARMRGSYWFGNTSDYFELGKLPELIKKHQGNLLAL